MLLIAPGPPAVPAVLAPRPNGWRRKRSSSPVSPGARRASRRTTAVARPAARVARGKIRTQSCWRWLRGWLRPEPGRGAEGPVGLFVA